MRPVPTSLRTSAEQVSGLLVEAKARGGGGGEEKISIPQAVEGLGETKELYLKTLSLITPPTGPGVSVADSEGGLGPLS